MIHALPDPDKPQAPLTHSGMAQLQSLGSRAVEFAIGTAERDARSLAQRRRQRAASRERLKLRTLLLSQQQLDLGSACSHRGISVSKTPHQNASLWPETNGTGHQSVMSNGARGTGHWSVAWTCRRRST
jgi:hypothetical protein